MVEVSKVSYSFRLFEKEGNESASKSIISDYETHFLQAFNYATSAGPLCGEPMSGVCFVVEGFEILDDSIINYL